MKKLCLLTLTTFFLFSTYANATPAPQPGELLGGLEFGFLSSVGRSSKVPKYSDAIHIGVSSIRFIPFGMSLDGGFLNQEKQRYTRIGLFNFGKQPIISAKAAVGVFYRAEVLSFNWNDGGKFGYSPGLELGVTLPFSKKYGMALFSKATLVTNTNNDNRRWGQEERSQGVFWVGVSLLRMSHHKLNGGDISPE
jgi:hypothetical protein